MRISVLTIVRGRQQHLRNQWQGLRQSRRLPDEWVVVGMGERPTLPETDEFPIHVDRVEMIDGILPLGEARNRAARRAAFDVYVFLDVDCIPSPALLGAFEEALRVYPQLWMGSIGYLPAGAAGNDWTFDSLAAVAQKHPAMPALAPGERLSPHPHEWFWSLCFAIRAADFDRLGGFDETFAGYGSEDTDFAFTAREQDLPFGVLGDRAYHQHHGVCKPPLNHFEPIVRNARQFRRKWGCWPMESWLTAFHDRGLIRFEPASESLDVLRMPTAQEIEAARVTTPAGF